MEITCKNCHQTYKGHYCNNCGQTANTHKINFHYLWIEIKNTLLHFDDKLSYTGKQLFTRPGHSIREYIEGKRVKHFKPISLVVLLATTYIALNHILNINMMEETKEVSSTNPNFDSKQLGEWLTSHFAWISLLFIPLHTIGTAICFRKQGYNFIEYLVLNTYKASQKLYISILCIPLYYYYSGTATISKITMVTLIIDFFLYFWTNEQFFNHLSKTKTFFLTLLCHIIFWIFVFIIACIILYFLGVL